MEVQQQRQSRPLPALRPDDDCQICMEALVPGGGGDGRRRLLFLCSKCRRPWTHFSCARSVVKADRVHSRLPLRCPFCRLKYGKEDLSPLLPKRREVNFKCSIQPLDENSDIELTVVEHYDARVQIPENPFEHDADPVRMSRKAVICHFGAQHLPVDPALHQPAVVVEASQREMARPQFRNVYLPQPPPPTTTTQHQSAPEEAAAEPLASPLRNIIRKHIVAERALTELKEAVSRLENPHDNRRTTRSSTSRRPHLDRLIARIACIRRLHYGLNSDLLDYLMS